jgi:hypothetical protein
MQLFNNRELATAFWVLIFSIWAIHKKEIRKSFVAFLRTLWNFKIILFIFLALSYVIFTVIILKMINIWEVGLLKDTIIWFFFGALAMVIRYITANDTDDIFYQILKDDIKVMILLEFIINTYTFPLIVELILVPFITFIAIFDVVSRMKEEYLSITKITKGIQIIFGLIILVAAFYSAIADFRNLESFDTLRSIVLVPILSVLLYPFIYVILIISKYEILFSMLDFGGIKSKSLKRYVRSRIILFARFNLKRLQYLRKNHTSDLMCIEKKSDVDSFLCFKGKAHSLLRE